MTPSDLIAQIRIQVAPTAQEDMVKGVQALETAKDNAYWERNQLVAALSKVFPSSLEWQEDGEELWQWIVFTDLPTGQVSFHIHDSELPHFEHLPRRQGRVWDNHSNEVKWGRFQAMQRLWEDERGL